MDYTNNPEVLQETIDFIRACAEKAGVVWDVEGPKTLQQGCATTLVAALDPSIEEYSGAYLTDCNIAIDKAAPETKSEENAKRLWVESEKLVGEKFEI
jgi:hypothetical protein